MGAGGGGIKLNKPCCRLQGKATRNFRFMQSCRFTEMQGCFGGLTTICFERLLTYFVDGSEYLSPLVT